MLGKCMSRPIALVTGGGRGIGAATCKRLAKDGYDILLTYYTSSKPAEMVVEDIRNTGGDALAVKVDCNDDGEVGLLGIHPWMHRGIDALVLNHGRYQRVAAEEMTIDDLRTTMKTNFEGAVGVWKAVQPHLTDRARIVVVGSQLGTRGSPHGADYSASKAALAMWARSLAQALGPQGKRVNILAPGYVDTELITKYNTNLELEKIKKTIPMQRFAKKNEISDLVKFLCSEDNSYITGQIITIDGGFVCK